MLAFYGDLMLIYGDFWLVYAVFFCGFLGVWYVLFYIAKARNRFVAMIRQLSLGHWLSESKI